MTSRHSATGFGGVPNQPRYWVMGQHSFHNMVSPVLSFPARTPKLSSGGLLGRILRKPIIGPPSAAADCSAAVSRGKRFGPKQEPIDDFWMRQRQKVPTASDHDIWPSEPDREGAVNISVYLMYSDASNGGAGLPAQYGPTCPLQEPLACLRQTSQSASRASWKRRTRNHCGTSGYPPHGGRAHQGGWPKQTIPPREFGWRPNT
jgi:hypothetical protein